MKFRVTNSQAIISSMRFDGSYHNAEANIYDDIIKSHSEHCLSYFCTEIFTSGRNRRIYTSQNFGVPFLSNSDVIASNPFLSCKYSSKKYGYDEKAVLRKGMILTGRVGAIGQTAFVSKYLEDNKAMGSDNIIRIVVNPEFKNGFIYAYLASRIGTLQIQKYSTGGVQPFISEEMVASLPIPVFPDDFQAKVDDLIQESSRLREEAADLLEKAKNMVEEFCNKPNAETTISSLKNISISKVRQSYNKRFDSSFFINSGVEWVNSLKRNTIRLGDCNIKLWYPGIFKRIYVNNGYPYIKGSDLFMTNPFRKCDYLSRTKTPILEQLWLKTRQILISCAGACGQVKLITKEYEDKNAIGSPDIIRMVSNDALFTTEYLFAYMQLSAVYQYMQSFKYGSVIERFDIANIANLPVVEPTKDLSETVTKIIQQYSDCTYKAFVAEETAINLVEKAIESWEK